MLTEAAAARKHSYTRNPDDGGSKQVTTQDFGYGAASKLEAAELTTTGRAET
jgi:hypothetical protein